MTLHLAVQGRSVYRICTICADDATRVKIIICVGRCSGVQPEYPVQRKVFKNY